MPELAGAVGFSRVSDGCCYPRQQARACWTTLSLSFSALDTTQWLVSSYLILHLHLPKPLFLAPLSGAQDYTKLWNLGGPAVCLVCSVV